MSQVEFGVFGGPQISFSRYEIKTKKQDNQVKFGFQAGAGLKVPFESKIFFSPIAFYSLKGYKVTLASPSLPPDSFAIDNNTTIHTFELSPLIQVDLGHSASHFFLRGGPSLDFQLFGKEQFNRSNAGPVDRKMKYGYADYGHFAANLLLHVGYETAGGLVIFAHFTQGVANLSNRDRGPRILHRAAGISLGYYFNKNKIVIDTRNKE